VQPIKWEGALEADGQVTRICRDPLASAMVARVNGSPLL
jgi:hypothetical protein